MTELTLGEFQTVLGYLLDNNRRLVDNGDTPISVCIEGEAGVGKTHAIQQVAEARNMTFTKINLAQIEEPAELIGFPLKEYKIIMDNKEQWVSVDVLKNLNCGFTITRESRMSYAVPAWVPSKENPNGTILCLDDFSRANTLVMQAIMEIINTGSYISWNLPRYTSVVLSSNPDNGSYTVTSLDTAVKSRMITFHAKFDIKEWMQWAENFGIDGRAINFAGLYHAEIFEPKNNVVIANARTYTTFCRAIAGIKDWNDAESLALILEIASGCFLEKDNILGSLFTTFIDNKLDRLVEPDRMVNGNWDAVSGEIRDCVYQDGKYRADIASILATRFMNYCDTHFGTEKARSKKVEERIDDFVTYHEKTGQQLFSQDILYSVIKVLCKNHVAQTNKWFLNKNIREISL